MGCGQKIIQESCSIHFLRISITLYGLQKSGQALLPDEYKNRIFEYLEGALELWIANHYKLKE